MWLTHLLLAPVYLVLGTLRHELAHALVGSLLGTEVRAVYVTPHWADEAGRVHYCPGEGRRFYFGRVLFGTGWRTAMASPIVHLAPYVSCAAFMLAGLCAVPWADHVFGDHGWVAAVVLCWVSPVVDICWNVMKWVVLGRGDLARAFPSEED